MSDHIERVEVRVNFLATRRQITLLDEYATVRSLTRSEAARRALDGLLNTTTPPKGRGRVEQVGSS